MITTQWIKQGDTVQWGTVTDVVQSASPQKQHWMQGGGAWGLGAEAWQAPLWTPPAPPAHGAGPLRRSHHYFQGIPAEDPERRWPQQEASGTPTLRHHTSRLTTFTIPKAWKPKEDQGTARVRKTPLTRHRELGAICCKVHNFNSWWEQDGLRIQWWGVF